MKLSFALKSILIVAALFDVHAQRGGNGNNGNGNGNGNNGNNGNGNNGNGNNGNGNGNGNGNNGNGNGNGNGNNRGSNVKVKNCNGRKCSVDTTGLDISNDTESISFELQGNGRSIKCNKQRGNGRPNKNRSWHGLCEGGGSANVIKRGKNNKNEDLVYGSVVDGNDICQLTPDAEGTNQVLCTAAEDFPNEAEPDETPIEVEGDTEASDNVRKLSVGHHLFQTTNFGLKGTATNLQSRRELLDDLGGNLDILVVWTKRAECRNSGLSAGCTPTSATENNMRGLIDLAIVETNTAYAMSGVDTTLRLVHAYRDPNYVEVSGDAFNAALTSVTGTTDGDLDDIHDKRTQYGADIVAMIIDDGQYCGIGWIGPYRSYMFSVTAWNCATGFYTFGHEVGHNLGCLHDRGTESACSASGFQYGYRDPNANFRTIMAYGCQSGQCDNNSGGFCSRAQVFSSSDPSLTINGLPIGNAQNDNARRINDVKSTVAAYFPFQAQCVSDSDCTTTDLCSPGVCNGVCSYQPISCDDNDVCTTDSCNGGNCVNTPVSCDDSNVCTTDSCDSIQGCTHTPIPNCCGNGICEATENSSSCPEDCFVGPFDLETNFCSSCYIREGLMFDMEALDSDIEIRSLTMYSYSGQAAEVWTRPGTHVGFEFSSSGWTKVADHAFSAGSFQTVEIPESSFTQTVTISAGSRQAFYLTFPSGQRQLYNFGQGSLDAVIAENSDLKIFEGPAKRYQFGSQTGPRVWNGAVTYVKAT